MSCHPWQAFILKAQTWWGITFEKIWVCLVTWFNTCVCVFAVAQRVAALRSSKRQVMNLLGAGFWLVNPPCAVISWVFHNVTFHNKENIESRAVCPLWNQTSCVQKVRLSLSSNEKRVSLWHHHCILWEANSLAHLRALVMSLLFPVPLATTSEPPALPLRW